MLPPDFKGQKKQTDHWYDTELDRVLIEQSIAKQYGVLPSAQEELKYSDWAKMVGGLMNDTPLGLVVQTRMETDRDVLKKLTPSQKQIRAEWAAFKASGQKENQDQKEQMRQLEAMIAGLFGRR